MSTPAKPAVGEHTDFATSIEIRNYQNMPKVFISATTRDLKSYRAVVAEWARAKGYEVVVQDGFPVQSDYATIVQMLREMLDPCDAVIQLAGLYYGFEPTNRPNGEARRSYTQLEYEIAKHHKKQVFRFLARTDYLPDNEFTQSDEQADLQAQHCQRLMQGDELHYEFSNHEELKSLLEKVHIRSTLAKPDNLPVVGSLFKGRDEFIEQLRSVLINKPTHIAAVTAKQAIHGLGGVGKTRVAVEYAKRFSHEYTAMLFITADSPANLQRNLAGLCGALVLNLPEKDAREQEVQVAAALRWLREHSGWFLIVDNVDTAEAATEVEGLLRQLETGHVVVTSRLSQWGDAVEELALDVISETAAKDFLLERTRGKRKPALTDDADAQALAMDLGQLPLALEQAGAFIAKHRGSFQGYRSRWKSHEVKVLAWHDQRSMRYPASVATTWQTSFELLSEDGRGLLNLLCWLAPDPIPLAMIEKLTSVDDEKAIDIESGIADLADYSLLKWTSAEHDAVQVHRLVEEITRMRIPESETSIWLQRALRMVNDFVPDEPSSQDVRSWPSIYDPAQSHLSVLIDSAELREIFEPTSRLMTYLAVYLLARADFSKAEPLIRRALAIDEHSYGAEHPDVATQLNNLAQLLKETNRLAEAEPLMRRALAIDEQSYGTEHPAVAIRLNNLASLLLETNRLVEAEQLMRRALAIDEQSFGTEHPCVATELNNLGHLLKKTNRLTEAEPLMRRGLAIDEQSYGTEHPNVATQLNNLAALLWETNRMSEAEPLIRRALAINEHSYGTEHPNVAGGLNNLAKLLQDTNRGLEAEPLMRRALAIVEQTYGTDHPRVALCLKNLSLLLQETNRLSEAEPLIRRALHIDEQAYGIEHPEVATDLNTLAQLLKETERLLEAEPLMRRALDIDEQCYGTEHPDVAIDLWHMALLLRELDRSNEGLPMIERAVQIYQHFEHQNGYEHPHWENVVAWWRTFRREAGLSDLELPD